MMVQTSNIYQNGKVFKEIDFHIAIRKEKIRVCERSITKAYRLAGTNGPRGSGGLDYSRVTSSTPTAHIGLADAIRLVERDQKQIKIFENEIADLRSRKRNLLKILKSLDGIEEQIYYHRVIMYETQESSAENIGLSTRHLQRIERQMRDSSVVFEI